MHVVIKLPLLYVITALSQTIFYLNYQIPRPHNIIIINNAAMWLWFYPGSNLYKTPNLTSRLILCYFLQLPF